MRIKGVPLLREAWINDTAAMNNDQLMGDPYLHTPDGAPANGQAAAEEEDEDEEEYAEGYGEEYGEGYGEGYGEEDTDAAVDEEEQGTPSARRLSVSTWPLNAILQQVAEQKAKGGGTPGEAHKFYSPKPEDEGAAATDFGLDAGTTFVARHSGKKQAPPTREQRERSASRGGSTGGVNGGENGGGFDGEATGFSSALSMSEAEIMDGMAGGAGSPPMQAAVNAVNGTQQMHQGPGSSPYIGLNSTGYHDLVEVPVPSETSASSGLVEAAAHRFFEAMDRHALPTATLVKGLKRHPELASVLGFHYGIGWEYIESYMETVEGPVTLSGLLGHLRVLTRQEAGTPSATSAPQRPQLQNRHRRHVGAQQPFASPSRSPSYRGAPSKYEPMSSDRVKHRRTPASVAKRRDRSSEFWSSQIMESERGVRRSNTKTKKSPKGGATPQPVPSARQRHEAELAQLQQYATQQLISQQQQQQQQQQLQLPPPQQYQYPSNQQYTSYSPSPHPSRYPAQAPLQQQPYSGYSPQTIQTVHTQPASSPSNGGAQWASPGVSDEADEAPVFG